MKITYDKQADALYIKFHELPVHETEEDKSGAILDYAEDGSIVGIEILNASKKIKEHDKVELQFL